MAGTEVETDDETGTGEGVMEEITVHADNEIFGYMGYGSFKKKLKNGGYIDTKNQGIDIGLSRRLSIMDMELMIPILTTELMAKANRAIGLEDLSRGRLITPDFIMREHLELDAHRWISIHGIFHTTGQMLI